MSINRLHKSLLASGVEVITDETHSDVHVSGHPRRDELKQLYDWVKPDIAVPVHGELHHLKAHANLSKDLGIKQTHVLSNGDVLKLSCDSADIIGSVYSGRIPIDGTRLLSADHKDIATRKQLMNNGALFISLLSDQNGKLYTKPFISTHGIFESEEDSLIISNLIISIEKTFTLEFDNNTDRELVEIIQKSLRREIMRTYKKNPVIDIHVINIES